MRRLLEIPVLSAGAFLVAGCSSEPSASLLADPPLDAATHDGADTSQCKSEDRLSGKCPTLSGYHLFDGSGASQDPRPGVYPYDVIAPLFADDAGKKRFIELPSNGKKVRYHADEPWELPVGAIVVKTFYYPRDARDPSLGERLIETRLLIRNSSEIVPITYVWNAAQTEATREVAGLDVPVAWIDETGGARSTEYRVPNTNDCKRCHGLDEVRLLGVRTRQLDRVATLWENQNQIDALAAAGFFESPLPVGPRLHMVDPGDEQAPIDARARSYLDANCGHCHNKTAAAEWSGLELDWGDRSEGALGICKIPSSAGDTGGRRFDVLPGRPEQSVLLYRMQVTNSAYRMPEGSRTPDAKGVEVISDWIEALPPDDCAHAAF
jgi:uncharacterized repeat protein (TIGR03806 family)